jgi:hypothetical protein
MQFPPFAAPRRRDDQNRSGRDEQLDDGIDDTLVLAVPVQFEGLPFSGAKQFAEKVVEGANGGPQALKCAYI